MLWELLGFGEGQCGVTIGLTLCGCGWSHPRGHDFHLGAGMEKMEALGAGPPFPARLALVSPLFQLVCQKPSPVKCPPAWRQGEQLRPLSTGRQPPQHKRTIQQ